MKLCVGAKQSPQKKKKKNKNFWVNYQSRAVVLMREREKREKNSDEEYEFLSYFLFFFSNNTIAVLGFDRNKTAGELSLIHHYSSDPALPTEESVRYNI